MVDERRVWVEALGSAGISRVFARTLVGPVMGFGGAGHVDVGVSVVGRVDLVALAEVFDDVQVDPSRFHEAVLQQPAVGFRVGVAVFQHVLQGGLEEADPRQHGELEEDRRSTPNVWWKETHKDTGRTSRLHHSPGLLLSEKVPMISPNEGSEVAPHELIY